MRRELAGEDARIEVCAAHHTPTSCHQVIGPKEVQTLIEDTYIQPYLDQLELEGAPPAASSGAEEPSAERDDQDGCGNVQAQASLYF